MPRKTQYRRKTKKAPRKTYRKKYQKRSTSRIRTLVIPNAMHTKLRFVDDSNTSLRISTGESNRSLYWNMNCLYDASVGLANTTVAGFAEWMGFYEKFRVMGFKYRITVTNRDTEPYRLLTYPSDDADYTSYAWDDWMQVRGNPLCKSTMLGGSAGGHETKTLSGYINLPKFSGNPVTYKADTLYEGDAGADPSKQFRLYLDLATYNGSTLGSNGQYTMVDAQFTYYVKFYNRRALVVG